MTPGPNVSAETLAAAGYAMFLVLAAAGLELGARLTHRRVHDAKTVGFQYHAHIDAWQCDEGAFLWRQRTRHAVPVARYRAHAPTCNRCASKCRCTDADDGREVVRPLTAWPFTEIGQFQRGISLMLLTLAALILVVEAIRHHAGAELVVLAAALGPTAIIAYRTLDQFRRTRRAPEHAAPHPGSP
ncbi:MAG: hypothetical protein ACM3JJ_09660 [Hyphomicrobiales bacterium]